MDGHNVDGSHHVYETFTSFFVFFILKCNTYNQWTFNAKLVGIDYMNLPTLFEFISFKYKNHILKLH